MLKVENANAFLEELDVQRIKHLDLHIKILKDHLNIEYNTKNGKIYKTIKRKTTNIINNESISC